MPIPPPASDHFRENSTTVLMTASVKSGLLEEWVKDVAKLSGQEVDWGFIGGRAIVSAIGDLEKVHQAMEQLRPVLDELYWIDWESLKENGDRAPWQPMNRPPMLRPATHDWSFDVSGD